MILADAIETWGQTYRDRLTQSQLEKLGTVWSAIKRSEVGGRTVATMTKDDAGQVMGLFPEHERAEIADLLNTVRKWTLTHAPPAQQAPPAASAPVTPVQPEPWPQPDPVQPDPVQPAPAASPFTAAPASPFDTGPDRTQAMPAATTAMPQVYDTAHTAAPAPDPAWGTSPAQQAYAPDAGAVTSVQGPPPSTFAPQKSGRPSMAILLGGVLVAALVAAVGYLVLIREPADAPMPATTTTDTGVTTTDGSTTGDGQATVGTDGGTTGTGTATVGTGSGESEDDRLPVDRESEGGAVTGDSGVDTSTTGATTDAATTSDAATSGEAPAATEPEPDATTDPNTGAATSTLDGETITSGSATVGLGSGDGDGDDRTSVERDDADG